MRIRKLERSEHILTRSLYKEVFTEDDEAFVDYYYKWKTKDNLIFVAEDADGIHAMVHLNPFTVQYRGAEQKLHYIVAVATQEDYRHQGLMRRLLALAEAYMKEAGEGLTFLMPASEKIYTPFGYRFFYRQRRGILYTVQGSAKEKSYDGAAQPEIRENVTDTGFMCRPVHPAEYETLARFANETLEHRYELYVRRDAAYYERLCAEQQCQGGEVMIICTEKNRSTSECGKVTEEEGTPQTPDNSTEPCGMEPQIIGVFCTAPDDTETGIRRMVLREVILDSDLFAEAESALRAYVKPYGSCRVEGCQPELFLEEETEVPLMMGKIPGGGVFTGLPDQKRVFLNEVV